MIAVLVITPLWKFLPVLLRKKIPRFDQFLVIVLKFEIHFLLIFFKLGLVFYMLEIMYLFN